MFNSGPWRLHWLKPAICLALALLLIGCKSKSAQKASKEISGSSTQGENKSVAPPTPSATVETAAENEKNVVYRNLGGGVRFVGSEECAPCHLKIYKDYMRTPHAQAATLPSQRPELRDLPAEGVSVCEQDGSHCFKVFRENGDYYMSQVEPGPNNTELSKDVQKIAYALGAPMAGVGYVIQRGNYLFEAPLSYYAGSQDAYPLGWGLSPGYEKNAYGFARPLVGSCMYCHVGVSRVIHDANNLYANPPIGELKVGCENCHGPGGLHVDEQRKHVAISGKIDTSIVNTAYLSPRINDDTCIYCHEFGEARIPQPGKKFEDFRPGTPLLSTMAIFKTRPIMGWNMMEWSDEMVQSKCYRASGGRLNCSSCHDPHASPTPLEAPAFYRSKCLSCHQGTSCRETLQKRRSTTPSDNCVSCHMPKHVAPRFVMLGTKGTSHWVVKYEGQPLPAKVSEEQSPDPATGLILVNKTPESPKTRLSPLVLLQAYQAVLARNPSRADLNTRYDLLLGELAKSHPHNLVVLRALARKELTKRSPEGNAAAQSYLSKAVGLDSKSPQDYMLLGELLYRSGRNGEAINTLEHAITLFPYIPTLYENLSVCHMAAGDAAKARKIVTDGLSKFPSDVNLRAIQKRLESSP
jgi:hypothetical protein